LHRRRWQDGIVLRDIRVATLSLDPGGEPLQRLSRCEQMFQLQAQMVSIAALAPKQQHLAGYGQAVLTKIVRAAPLERLDRLDHFQAVPNGVTERLIHL